MLCKKLISLFIILFIITLLAKPSYAESVEQGSSLPNNTNPKDINLQTETQQNIDRNLRNLQNITPLQEGIKIKKSTEKDNNFNAEEEKECFIFKQINIEGNKVISKRKLAKITNKYLNKCISIAIAQQVLLEEIIKVYQSESYILAVPYIPEQNLKQGVLQIVIKEGILTSIDYDHNILSKSAVYLAFVGILNKPVNLRYLEQALENLNKFGAYKVTFKLQPGMRPGETILVLNAEKAQKFIASATVNNDYNSLEYKTFPNLYNHKLLANFTINSFLFNDRLSLFAQTNLHKNTKVQEGVLGFSYSLPIGYWDFILSNNINLSRVISKQTYSTYNIDTVAGMASLDIKRTLVRGHNYILKGVVRPNYYETNTFLNKARTENGYKLYFLDVGFEYQFFNPYVSVLTTAFYTRGQPLFNQKVQKGSKQNQIDLIPQNQFNIAKLTVNTTVPIVSKLSYNNNLAVQYSSDILYTINDFVVISKQGVRGYQGVYANYNSGFTMQNELTLDLFSFNNNYINKVSVLAAVDMGAAIDGYNLSITHKKILYGYYVELRTTGKIAMTVGFAAPLNYVYMPRNSKVVNFSVTLTL